MFLYGRNSWKEGTMNATTYIVNWKYQKWFAAGFKLGVSYL